MDLLNTITGVAVDHAWDPIRRHFGYLISYKRNIKKLEREFDELDALRKDVQREVDAARRDQLEKINSLVQTWLMNVDRMEEEVKRIKDKLSVISNKRFLHINLRYKLGRKAANHIETTNDLIRKGKFDRVSHKRSPPSTTDSLLFNEDYVIFNSRKSHEEKILEVLKDEAVHLVGLCGMGGAGKTTLVKEVAKQAKKHGLFGEVVMVAISQNIDLKRTQTVIAESLGLVLTEDSVEVRAVKLAERLISTENKVLVILDDLWKALDLSKVRIPLPQMGSICKVVITTRNKDVCERMSCQEIVELKMLSDEESWSLFRSKAGDAVESPTIRELAWNVARECAGLPLALVVLGTALKGKRPENWNTVLMQLKKSMEVDLLGVSKEVFQSIKLSFDFLENEAAKSCFLHCCLYPEDYDIPNEELMHMTAGGGLLADVSTLNEAQSRVDLLLDQLKACGLLLQGSSEGYVRMHDVVRDVAVRISAKDHAFYVRAGQGLVEWPETIKREMYNCQRLSLMCNDIEDLPPDPMEYPKLETLILSDNEGLSSIPEVFFQHMGSLMVLDLSSTGIKSLPESLSCLTNLRVLNLGKCYSLNDISHINWLKMLEILILDGAPVSIAPEGAAWVKNLRFVNLGFSVSFRPFLDNYFSKELPKFHRLERLFMNKFVGSFRELTSLRHLTHLFIYQVADLDDSLSHELVSPGSWPDQLLEFNICFLQDEPRYYWSLSSHRRVLQLMGTKPLAVWVKRLLEKTINSVLVEFQGAELISINSSNIPLLAFSSLEHLRVVNWPNLTKLLGNELLLLQEQIPLSQLKQMTISNCPRLTNLIPSRLWQQSMQKLEELSVKDCPLMVELFPCDHNQVHGITELLPRLKSLTLQGLQRLPNVLQPFQCLPELEGLTIHDCGMRYALSFEMETVAMSVPFPTLEELHIKNCQEIIEMISPRTSLQALCFFQGLFSLKIESCPRLTHLFSYKQATGMQHLSKLYIRNCAALKAVVISMENEEEASASTSTHVVYHESYSLFPNLRELTLYDLPQLTAFHHPATLPIDWLYLQRSCIEECQNLHHPFFGPRTRAHEQARLRWFEKKKRKRGKCFDILIDG